MGESLVVHESPVPFESARIRAAAVYCSDGRFGEQIDDFLHAALALPRYDRLAIPGGPACLAGYFDTYRERDAAIEQLKFLVHAHRLSRLVLIAHQDCAFYTERLKVPEISLARQQHEDLGKAVSVVRDLGAHLYVEAYFAVKRGASVAFESIAV